VCLLLTQKWKTHGGNLCCTADVQLNQIRCPDYIMCYAFRLIDAGIWFFLRSLI